MLSLNIFDHLPSPGTPEFQADTDALCALLAHEPDAQRTQEGAASYVAGLEKAGHFSRRDTDQH